MPAHVMRALCRLFSTACIMLPILTTPLLAAGNGTGDNPYLVSETTSPIDIDGNLDDAGWAQALTLPLEYEWSPGDNIEPAVRTEVLLTWDAGTLYAAFRCHDPRPEEIRARLVDRDECFDNDHVNIHIDTFNDERGGFSFGGNPLGNQMDATNRGGGFDWGRDGICNSTERRSKTSLSAE